MKQIFIVLLMILLVSCSNNKVQNDFINYDCNIPIIECVLGDDTVNVIVDSGAEYSLIDSEYYQKHNNSFKIINSIETQFSGIGGTNTQISRIVATDSNLGYITFIE
jgi:hypothetical protein